jgi:uncharacterized protein (TIGR03435 family)
MRKLLVAFCLLGGITIAAQDKDPTFEVASVKQNTSNDGGQFIRMLPGNRFSATNMPPRALITLAYQLQQFQLVGGPSWITSERYDIVAKVAGGELGPFVPGQPNPMMLAMRGLLTDRFKLKFHKETRELDVYNLVMIKPGVAGPSLKPAATDCAAQAAARRGGPPPGPPPGPPGPNDPFPCGLMGTPGMIRMGGMPISQMTQMLTNQTGRLVFDKTNLTGNWDFLLKYQFEQRGGQPLPPGINLPPPDPDAPSLYTAIQEQLGMKLESAKAPVEVTVIDSIEHPTED